MKQPLLVNFYQDLPAHLDKVSQPTGANMGERLFGKLLEKVALGKENNPKGHCRTVGVGDVVKKKMEEINKLGGLLGGNLAISPANMGLLKTFLLRLGVKETEISTVLTRSTDRDGFVRLDRLWRQVQELLSEKAQQGSGLAIGRCYLPQLGLIFLRLGAETQQLKGLMDKYALGKTQVGLKDISAMMHDLAPGIRLDEAGTKEFLQRAGIPIQPGNTEGLLGDSEVVEKAMSSFAANTQNSQGQSIKELLAHALQEKGLSPGKVKEILEGIDFSRISNDAIPLGNRGPITEEEIRGLIDSIEIKTKPHSGIPVIKEQILSRLRGLLGKEKSNRLSNVISKGPDSMVKAQTNPMGLVADERVDVGIRMKEENRLKGSIADLHKRSVSFPGAEHIMKTLARDIHSIAPEQGQWVSRNETVLKIFEHIKLMILGGEQESRITLHPPELGHMDLRILTRQGHLQIQLGTEHPWAKEIVEANLNALRHHLTQAGFIVDKLEVMVGLGGNGFQAHSGDKGGQGNLRPSHNHVSPQLLEAEKTVTAAVPVEKDHQLSIVV